MWVVIRQRGQIRRGNILSALQMIQFVVVVLEVVLVEQVEVVVAELVQVVLPNIQDQMEYVALATGVEKLNRRVIVSVSIMGADGWLG